MPDIHAFLKKSALRKPICSNISEINSSCPNLRDEAFFDNRTQFDNDSVASIENDDVFEEYDDFSENVSVCSESYQHESEPDSYKNNDSRYFSDFSNSKPRTTKTVVRRKKKEERPAELLRKNLKLKHFTSLYNLPNRKRNELDHGYDSYYTVHGENNLTPHSPSPYSNYSHFDSPPTNDSKTPFRTNFGSVDRFRTFHQHTPHHDHSLYTRSISSPHSNLNQTHHFVNPINETEIIYKCCCGGSNCKKVVPIFDYLETYFAKTVRFFKFRLKRHVVLVVVKALLFFPLKTFLML